MPRAFWNGAISFGMVVIPVKMYVATQIRTISFRLLHKKCLTRPKQVYYCEHDNEHFGSEEMLRGYEYTKGQYVVMDENDFKKVPVKTAHLIDIVGFVNTGDIDPIYFHGCHYLMPEELGKKPFFLLKKALEKTQRVGIAKVSFSKREHLCCLRPFEDTLALHTMHYLNEVLPREEIAPPKEEAAGKEFEMATDLVNARAIKFKAEEYHDEYRAALEKVVEAKVKGEEIKVPKAPKIQVGDLMSALKASIEAAKKESESREPALVGGGKRK